MQPQKVSHMVHVDVRIYWRGEQGDELFLLFCFVQNYTKNTAWWKNSRFSEFWNRDNMANCLTHVTDVMSDVHISLIQMDHSGTVVWKLYSRAWLHVEKKDCFWIRFSMFQNYTNADYMMHREVQIYFDVKDGFGHKLRFS